MVILALDLGVIAIVVFCGWRGYRNGLIRGVFGVVSLIVSLFVASVAANAYSGEFTDMLNPFIGGVVESTLADLAASGSGSGSESAAASESAAGSSARPELGSGPGSAAASESVTVHEVDTAEFENKPEAFKTAYSALRRIGLPESSAARVADMVINDDNNSGAPTVTLSDLITDKLSSALAFVAVFGIAFILLAIIFTVIGNLVGFVFSLPGLRIIDIATGVIFGLAKGLLIVFALAAIVRYLGLLAPDTLEGTSVLKYIVNNNPIAGTIGI